MFLLLTSFDIPWQVITKTAGWIEKSSCKVISGKTVLPAADRSCTASADSGKIWLQEDCRRSGNFRLHLVAVEAERTWFSAFIWSVNTWRAGNLFSKDYESLFPGNWFTVRAYNWMCLCRYHWELRLLPCWWKRSACTGIERADKFWSGCILSDDGMVVSEKRENHLAGNWSYCGFAAIVQVVVDSRCAVICMFGTVAVMALRRIICDRCQKMEKHYRRMERYHFAWYCFSLW